MGVPKHWPILNPPPPPALTHQGSTEEPECAPVVMTLSSAHLITCPEANHTSQPSLSIPILITIPALLRATRCPITPQDPPSPTHHPLLCILCAFETPGVWEAGEK